MFSSQRGAFGGDLNQSSATAIPINSMYDGEEERKAAIPPPLEEKAAEEEEVIEETRREDRDEVTESKEKLPETQETAVKEEAKEESPAKSTSGKVETDVKAEAAATASV